MSAWSSCGQPEVRADAVLPRLAARDDRPLRQPEPLGAHALPHVDVRVAQDPHVRGIRARAAAWTTRCSLVPGSRWSTSTPIRRPGPGLEVARSPPTRSSTPSSISTTTPSIRRSSPHTFSTSSASWRPSTKIRDPLATRALAPSTAREPGRRARGDRLGLGELRAGRRGRRGQDDRGAVEQEARAHREALGAPAPVLEVDDAHAAGLLDAHHGAAPAGLDVLDDQAGLGLHLAGAAPRGDLPVTGQDIGAIAVGHRRRVCRAARRCRAGAPPVRPRPGNHVDLALAERECQRVRWRARPGREEVSDERGTSTRRAARDRAGLRRDLRAGGFQGAARPAPAGGLGRHRPQRHGGARGGGPDRGSPHQRRAGADRRRLPPVRRPAELGQADDGGRAGGHRAVPRGRRRPRRRRRPDGAAARLADPAGRGDAVPVADPLDRAAHRVRRRWARPG